MSDKSPLFVSALELLSHATELYDSKNAKKYKFVILHLANSIELLLKDVMIDEGISIYKSPKETVSIWGCFDELAKAGIAIPEKPIIELLIDDRNTIQHRFGFPDAESVYYYLSQVVAFYSRFLSDYYKLDLAETLKPHLTKSQMELLGLVENEYKYLAKLMDISPQAAIVQAYAIIERKIIEHLGAYLPTVRGGFHLFWRHPIFKEFLRELKERNYLAQSMEVRFEQLREARNYAAHVAVNDSRDVDWNAAFKMADELLNALRKAEEAGYSFVPKDRSGDE